MKQIFMTSVLVACFAGVSPAAAIEEKGQGRPGPQAVGYSCVDHSRKGESDVVLTPPTPGFKCPPGTTLFLVTRQLQDQVAAAPQTNVEEPGPTPAPGTPAPKKASKKQRCVPTYGGMYCCTGEPPRNCRIK
jgi:hypothetical protein